MIFDQRVRFDIKVTDGTWVGYTMCLSAQSSQYRSETRFALMHIVEDMPWPQKHTPIYYYTDPYMISKKLTASSLIRLVQILYVLHD